MSVNVNKCEKIMGMVYDTVYVTVYYVYPNTLNIKIIDYLVCIQINLAFSSYIEMINKVLVEVPSTIKHVR